MRPVIKIVLACAIGLAPAVVSTVAFADDATGKGSASVVILLNSSGSMKEQSGSGKTRMEAAKVGLRKVIESVPDDSKVGLRVYGASISSGPKSCKDTNLLVPVETVDKAKLKAGVKKLKPLRNTPITYSLKKAAKDLPKTGSRTIVLVSDGEENCGGDPCKAARDISKEGTDLHVDVIGLQIDSSREISPVAWPMPETERRPVTPSVNIAHLADRPATGSPFDDPLPITGETRFWRRHRRVQLPVHCDARRQLRVGLLLLYVSGHDSDGFVNDLESDAGIPGRVKGNVAESGEGQTFVPSLPRVFAACLEQSGADPAAAVGRIYGQLLDMCGAAILKHLGKTNARPAGHQNEAWFRDPIFSRSHVTEELRTETLDQQLICCGLELGNSGYVFHLDHPHQRAHRFEYGRRTAQTCYDVPNRTRQAHRQ